ncbi:MAG: cytochrome c3 family protein [Nitrospirota bacterium]
MKVFNWMKGKARGLLAPVIERLKEPLSLKARLIIIGLALVVVLGGGFIAYKFYDFTQNNPKFCVGCHLMQPAFDSWAKSEHKSLNCHDCHHLTVPEQNMLLVNFVLHRPNSVPERHGKVIVSSKICNECHTEGKAMRINRSLFHAKHVYMEQLECTECHGEVGPNREGLHRFLPTERFCTKCHTNRTVHGEGMGGLACLNCHTDRTKDLKPGRMKCLYCHSADERVRKEITQDATIDVKFFKPDPSLVKRATKIVLTEQSPMQFYCYECHKPHTAGKVRPQTETCLACHANVRNVGKHKIHLNMEMKCKDCHKPHVWKVTEASAKKDCVQCHEYRSPKAFL